MNIRRCIFSKSLMVLSLCIFVSTEARAACSAYVAPFDDVCKWISGVAQDVAGLYGDLTDWMNPYFTKVESFYSNSEKMLTGFEQTLVAIPEAIEGLADDTIDHIKTGYEMVDFFLLQQEQDYEQFVSSCNAGRCADFKAGVRRLVGDVEQLARDEQDLLYSNILPPKVSFSAENTLGDFFNNTPPVPRMNIDLTIIKNFVSDDVPDFMFYPLERAIGFANFGRHFPGFCESNDQACNSIYAISDVLEFISQAFEAVETVFVGTCAEIYAQSDYVPIYNYAGNFLSVSGMLLRKFGEMNRTAADISIKGVDAGASVGAEVTVTTDIKVQSAIGKIFSSLGSGSETIGGFVRNKMSSCREIMNQQLLMCVVVEAGLHKTTDDYEACMDKVLDVTDSDYRRYGF